VTAFMPTFARYSDTDKQKTQKIFDYQNIILLAIAIPVLCGGYILGNGLIFHLYGTNYMPSVLALKILLIMAGLSYLSTSLGYTLFIYNQQRKVFWAYLVGTLLNVPLNALLIPKIGFYGASIATVVTSFINLVILIYLAQRLTPMKIIDFVLVKYLFIIFAASLSMSVFLILGAKYNLNIFLKILGGGFIYLLILGIFIFNIKRYLKYEHVEKHN